MVTSIQEWHRRYRLQTGWTRGIANHLFQKTGVINNASILEVGCGTGAVLQELIPAYPSRYVGIDINMEYLFFARDNQPKHDFMTGDAHFLPIAEHSFDVCLCHFVLLWLANPMVAIREMCRVTRPDGIVMALAEPDYDGRIDYPDELSIIGEWQRDSLRSQGAEPCIGRKLRALFAASGLEQVEAGVLGGEWKQTPTEEEQSSEWSVIRSDLENEPEKLSQLEYLYEIDLQANQRGERILYVPMFYAWGKVP